MSFNQLNAGKDIPNDFNVVIEIPAFAPPIKYEVDKETGTVHVDRFMPAPMFYPCNYGYIPQTLALDGDPTDVLVITPIPLGVGVVVRCRPLGMLNMTDESGEDAKILAVPITKLTALYDGINEYRQLPENTLRSIEHFFMHYKELEKNKWVKITGWSSIDLAKQEIFNSVQRYKK